MYPPTPPSEITLTPTNPAPTQALDLTQGRVGTSPETWIDWEGMGLQLVICFCVTDVVLRLLQRPRYPSAELSSSVCMRQATPGDELMSEQRRAQRVGDYDKA